MVLRVRLKPSALAGNGRATWPTIHYRISISQAGVLLLLAEKHWLYKPKSLAQVDLN